MKEPMRIRLKKGLDIPIAGKPRQVIEEGPQIGTYAVLGEDFPGLKPKLEVETGDTVKKGQCLFTDKRNGVSFTSPVSGKVKAVNRGERRKLLSVVIEKENSKGVKFKAFTAAELKKISCEVSKKILLDSGAWTSLRQRPFDTVPSPESEASSIFVNLMNTNPLAPDPTVVLAGSEEAFLSGIRVLKSLIPEKKIYICKSPSTPLILEDMENVEIAEFSGPHPAGLSGTHIHFIDPVNLQKRAWYIDYQNLINVGRLFMTGELSTEKVISIGGSGVEDPRLVRTEDGASVPEILSGDKCEEGSRIISGSVLNGRKCDEDVAFLGRFHEQISVIPEVKERVLLNWMRPGFNVYSMIPVFASAIGGVKKHIFNTDKLGSHRAIIPIGMYEKVMPLDIHPTFLIKSLLSKDIERSEELGCLELAEEDLALCTFVCPGKTDFGPVIRDMLTTIEKEG